MTNSNSILLYVTDALKSAAFYTRLLGQEPVDASPTFAMFIPSQRLGPSRHEGWRVNAANSFSPGST